MRETAAKPENQVDNRGSETQEIDVMEDQISYRSNRNQHDLALHENFSVMSDTGSDLSQRFTTEKYGIS